MSVVRWLASPEAGRLAWTLAVGFATGVITARHLHPGRRISEWADRKVSGPHGAGWWIAQAVMAVEIAWAVSIHPRRTRAHLRTWREARHAPAPVFDSQWIHRKDSTDA